MVRALQAWSDSKYNVETWRCSVWEVDSELHTFVATRSLEAPPPEFVLKVVEPTGRRDGTSRGAT